MFHVERPASTRGAVPRPIALWQPRRRLSASSPRRLYGRMRSGSRPTAHGPPPTAHRPRPTGVIPQGDPPTVTPHEIPVARAVRHRGARVISRETAPQDPSAGGGAPDKALLAAAPPPGCPRIRSHAHQHPSNGRSAERCRSAHARNCCCSSATRARHGIRLRPHGGNARRTGRDMGTVTGPPASAVHVRVHGALPDSAPSTNERAPSTEAPRHPGTMWQLADGWRARALLPRRRRGGEPFGSPPLRHPHPIRPAAPQRIAAVPRLVSRSSGRPRRPGRGRPCARTR